MLGNGLRSEIVKAFVKNKLVQLEFCWNLMILSALFVLMVSSHFCLWFAKMELRIFFHMAHSWMGL